jgi:hypothetical protein
MTMGRIRVLPDQVANRSGAQIGGALRAFLLSPLGAVAVLSLSGLSSYTARTGSSDLKDTASAVVIFTLLSYLAALVVGVPIFLSFGEFTGCHGSPVPLEVRPGSQNTIETRRPEMVASMVAGMAAGLLFAQLERRRGAV